MNNRLNNTEEWISDLDDRIMETTQSKQQAERQMNKNESSVWDLWSNIICANLCIIGVPEREEKEGKCIWRNYSWELLKFKERNWYTGTGSPEGYKKVNPNRLTPRHIIIKMAKLREYSKGSGRKTKSQLQGNSHKAYKLIFSQKLCRLKGSGKTY